MQTQQLTAALEIATAAARIGGQILRARFGTNPRVLHKGEINLVTEVDLAAEAAIVEHLRTHFPTDSILAEEGTTGGLDPTRLWIVDPLDGTTNFAHGYPVFAVSIALEVQDVVELGVVYQPMLDELFTATRGGGAFLNGQPLRVSVVNQLGQSLLSTGFPYERAEVEHALDLFARFVRTAQAVRRDGSAALNLCYVAAGRFDGFWERSLGPWDVAAGNLIVREAGGKLSDYGGGVCDIRAGEIIASNGHIHGDMLKAIAVAGGMLI